MKHRPNVFDSYWKTVSFSKRQSTDWSFSRDVDFMNIRRHVEEVTLVPDS